jgi:hypothetical protein
MIQILPLRNRNPLRIKAQGQLGHSKSVFGLNQSTAFGMAKLALGLDPSGIPILGEYFSFIADSEIRSRNPLGIK